MAFAKGKKNIKIEKHEAEQVLAIVKPLKAPSVVTELAEVQVAVQETFAGLTSKITDKLALVDNLDKAISLKEDRLKELHGIEAAAVSLDDIKAQHTEEDTRWQQQVDVRQARWDEEDVERDKQVTREAEEHTYSFEQMSKKALDEHKALVATNQRQEAVRVEQLKKSWDDRSAALAAQEKEVNELRLKVANIPTEIDNAVKREVAIATNSVKREYETKIALASKDAEANAKINEANNASMKQQLTSYQQQIVTLQAELKAANDRAEAIAAKALDASSGRQALEAVERANASRDQGTKGTR